MNNNNNNSNNNDDNYILTKSAVLTGKSETDTMLY